MVEEKKTKEILDVFIVGGGISGLSLLFYLNKLNLNCRLIEKTERVGGVIKSQEINNLTLNLGPQTVLLEPELKQLISDLGIEEKIIYPDAQAKSRYLGRPKKSPKILIFPNGPKAAMFSGFFSVFQLLRIIRELFGGFKKGVKEDLSISELLKSRFGKKLTDEIFSAPFVGIWASSIDELSARSVLPKVYEAYKNGSSILKSFLLQAKRKKMLSGIKIVNLTGGLETLVNKLEDASSNQINKQEEINFAKFEQGIWSILTNKGEYLAKNLVLSNSPASMPQVLNRIEVEDDAKNEFENFKKLACEIKTSPIGILHLAVPKNRKEKAFNGFGLLIPPEQVQGLLGVIYSSSLFPNTAPDELEFITCFCGGSIQPQFADVNNQEVTNTLVAQVKNLFEIKGTIEVVSKTYWQNGIVKYQPFHFKFGQALERLNIQLPSLHLNSSILNGTSVPSRVKNSLNLANELEMKTGKGELS